MYGACPAEKRLGAWLEASHPVYIDITKALKALKKLGDFRAGLPLVFGSTSEAPMLPGFETRTPPNPNPNPRKLGGKGAEGAGKGAGAGAGTEAGKEMGRAMRLKVNPKSTFYYADGTFSSMSLLYDWPAICKLHGWDHAKTCGPYQCSMTTVKSRDYTCMDASHE